MPNRNLEPGQYQIGDFVFGDYTLFRVEEFSEGAYDVNVQDYQAQLSDEIRFGSDSLKGMPIQMIINAFQNSLMSNVVAVTGDTRELNFDDDPTIGEFTREWRADEIRKEWGELKPIYYCRDDGVTVQVYGRPGKLAVSTPDREGARKITAEFRRSDTLCYTDFEWFTQTRVGEKRIIFRSSKLGQGDAPSWLRFFLVGPMKNPTIHLGSMDIHLEYELLAGDIVEISSYPWARRAIRLNDGLSLNAYVTQSYLEKLAFDVDAPIELSWEATNTNTAINNIDFSTYPNTSDGIQDSNTDWTASTYSAGTGKWRISGGKLIWDDAGNGYRRVASIFKQPTISKYQVVGFTTDQPAEDVIGGIYPSNRIIGRSNATGTEYLYWDITYTGAWFGYHAPDGTEIILSEVFPLRKHIDIIRRILNNFGTIFGGSGNPVAGWQYDAEFGTGAGVLTSSLHINNTKLFTYNGDPGITLNDDNLYTGLGMYATQRGTGQSTPAGLTEFHMRDNPIVPINISSVYMMWRDAWQNI